MGLPSGGYVLSGGPISIATAQGEVALSFDHLVIAGGRPVGGSPQVDDAADVFTYGSVGLTITENSPADVRVLLDDGRTANFVLDLETGSVTPAS